jgi:hypothetical protein
MTPATEPRAAEKSGVLEPEPATIQEAQAQLERARAQLGAGAGAAGGLGAARGTGSVTSATTTTEAPTSRVEAAPPAASASADEGGRAAACMTPCRAIASMRRAVEAICRMAGAQDTRCTDARKTLGDSETRVAGCGC